jgi:hypothetical protein
MSFRRQTVVENPQSQIQHFEIFVLGLSPSRAVAFATVLT